MLVIQSSTRHNIESMDVASKAVFGATELAGESGGALKRIVELSVANSEQIQNIATAAEEQSASTEEVSRGVEEVNKIVIQTSEAMQQAATAISELARLSEDLKEMIKELGG